MNERVHLVKENDTLQRISAFYWGDWTLWPLLRDSNAHLIQKFGFDWSEKLTEGIALKIPLDLSISDLDHTVAEGDTYESLSLFYYSTEHFSERIRNENERRILRYSIGNRITIPALVDRRSFENAKERIAIWH
ncbi:LysM peptidoglycan-binding domain-containing protein [Leptospira santarosai]|uniref:LysM peptidoglycan-binding domain-containing protein n=1 Tax=Leptospira santarosai TaxID=28183 RepID=UPI0024AFBCB3|nr:LysM peptidoglycan-binding domain-containing protein [Leptospira santarosai]MDI7187987.1 LysM peptidoglycan-binding domain-containing protein [Leptospira santarosai]MDI7213772.1 LysM peptidoglycan-binding domain-containing protein [Leptospira santarosai]